MPRVQGQLREPDDPVLDVRVARGASGTVTLTVVGEVDTLSAPPLRKALDAVRSDDCRRLVVDLTAVTFLNATGLRTLQDVRRVADERGEALGLVPSPGVVARLLDWVALPVRPPGQGRSAVAPDYARRAVRPPIRLL
jgi:anti-sigma B factor antagonist